MGVWVGVGTGGFYNRVSGHGGQDREVVGMFGRFSGFSEIFTPTLGPISLECGCRTHTLAACWSVDNING